MATKALAPVAPRAGHDRVSAIEYCGRGQDWRHILAGQDGQPIWQSLFFLINSSIPDDQTRCEQLAQETFLYLLACGRLDYYIQAACSNDETEWDLLAYLNG